MPQNNSDNSNLPQPVKPKKRFLGLSPEELATATVGQGAALADELTTERNLRGGAKELDPLARPLTKLPEPAYLASGAMLTAGLSAAAHELKNSPHKLLRIIGDVAQPIQIGLNAGNAANNALHEPSDPDSVEIPNPPVVPYRHR